MTSRGCWVERYTTFPLKTSLSTSLLEWISTPPITLFKRNRSPMFWRHHKQNSPIWISVMRYDSKQSVWACAHCVYQRSKHAKIKTHSRSQHLLTFTCIMSFTVNTSTRNKMKTVKSLHHRRLWQQCWMITLLWKAHFLFWNICFEADSIFFLLLAFQHCDPWPLTPPPSAYPYTHTHTDLCQPPGWRRVPLALQGHVMP